MDSKCILNTELIRSGSGLDGEEGEFKGYMLTVGFMVWTIV